MTHEIGSDPGVVNGMELIGELEHDTPPPGLDGQKAQSEPGTGTDDEGSEANSEREHSEHAKASRRTLEDAQGHGDGCGKAHPHRNADPHISSSSRFDNSKIESRPRSNHLNLQGRVMMQMDSRDDEGCSPFSFLQEGDTLHKRKLSDVSEAQQHEGLSRYQQQSRSAAQEGTNPEIAYPTRNVVRAYTYTQYRTSHLQRERATECQRTLCALCCVTPVAFSSRLFALLQTVTGLYLGGRISAVRS